MADIEDKFPSNSSGKPSKIFLPFQFIVRILVIVATFFATYLMVTNKQTINIAGLAFDAKYSYSPTFKCFVLLNFIAGVCSVLSVPFLCICGRRRSKPGRFFFLFLHDLLMLCLVLAGCSAAMAVGYIGKYGNDHSAWMPICDHLPKFCNRGQIAMICSFAAAILLLILSVSSARRSRHIQT